MNFSKGGPNIQTRKTSRGDDFEMCSASAGLSPNSSNRPSSPQGETTVPVSRRLNFTSLLPPQLLWWLLSHAVEASSRQQAAAAETRFWFFFTLSRSRGWPLQGLTTTAWSFCKADRKLKEKEARQLLLPLNPKCLDTRELLGGTVPRPRSHSLFFAASESHNAGHSFIVM